MFTETLRECPSKKAAQKILDKRLQKINGANGGMTQSMKMMSDLLKSVWPYYLVKQKVKDSSRSAWDSIINKWISPYFGNRVLILIDPEDVGNFINSLTTKGLSSKYQVNIYQVLRLMFDVAQLNGYVSSNPVHPKIHRPSVDQEKRYTWSVDQAKSLLSAVAFIYRAPLIVLALAGIRAGKLLALR